MLSLSGAADSVVSWSDFSLQHKKVRKLKRILFISQKDFIINVDNRGWRKINFCISQTVEKLLLSKD